MTILAAVGERESRRIGKAARRAVDNFGNQGKRLKRARPEILQQQKFGEVMQIAFIGDGEHGAETLQIDIRGANLVMARHAQVTRGVQSCLRIFASDVEQRGLRRFRLSID